MVNVWEFSSTYVKDGRFGNVICEVQSITSNVNTGDVIVREPLVNYIVNEVELIVLPVSTVNVPS